MYIMMTDLAEDPIWADVSALSNSGREKPPAPIVPIRRMSLRERPLFLPPYSFPKKSSMSPP